MPVAPGDPSIFPADLGVDRVGDDRINALRGDFLQETAAITVNQSRRIDSCLTFLRCAEDRGRLLMVVLDSEVGNS